MRLPDMATCKKCLIGNYIPGMKIENGVCQYCRIHDKLERQYPISFENLQRLGTKVKKAGKRQRYDCLIGISGGCDSSYLLHLAVKVLRLHALVIHFDNRWNTEIAESNMRKMVDALGVDFIRYQLNKQMYDKLNRAFLEVSVSDADIPNDMAMLAIFKDVAKQYKIKYIFNGHSFRTEGTVPLDWTYMDAKYIQSVYFSRWGEKIEGFPMLTLWKQLKWALTGIKEARPLYFMPYRKEKIKKYLAEKYGWEDYGGHHLENKYTAFITSYFLPKKFNIDKRIIEYSALIRSEQLTKEEAEEKLKEKLCLSKDILKEIKQMYPNFNDVMKSKPKKSFQDFKTYHNLFRRYKWLVWILAKFHLVPETFYAKYVRGL